MTAASDLSRCKEPRGLAVRTQYANPRKNSSTKPHVPRLELENLKKDEEDDDLYSVGGVVDLPTAPGEVVSGRIKAALEIPEEPAAILPHEALATIPDEIDSVLLE